MNDFKVIKRLGHGCQAAVYEVEHKKTNRRYALKVMFNQKQDEELTSKSASIFYTTNILKNFEREYIVLTEKVPDHINIVKIWTLFIDNASSNVLPDWKDAYRKYKLDVSLILH